ncbi:polysaccharide deacetylase family protein [Salegentibacter sp. Hel_I_6]|uniref:polysaccharide deacetylase family protein n=1 Tax=Salegentibacter sp. Hel_I_6 TaxID=1250278 RepID=UPI000563F849|nr:polysaccharide deacetylase family protein [Salegentibacter sp. Hel_I_6]
MNPFFVKYPYLLKRLYPNRITRIEESNTIYLTFDDGPIPEITPWVLEQLEGYNAKATFFCIGENIQKNPDIFQEIINRGHSIGNHTFNHINGWKSNTKAYIENVLKTEEIISEKRNESRADIEKNQELEIKKSRRSQNSQPETSNQKLFRPAYGKIKNSQAGELVKRGYKIVMWDVLSGDFDSRISKEKCFKNVTNNASEGSTVVFHDSIKASKNLKFSLPKVLDYYAKKGFSFKAL